MNRITAQQIRAIEYVIGTLKREMVSDKYISEITSLSSLEMAQALSHEEGRDILHRLHQLLRKCRGQA